MPAIPKTSDGDVIDAAKQIVCNRGVGGLSMQALGYAVGIKAPSLYKRFVDRDDIIRRVQLAEFSALAKAISDSTQELPPSEAIRAIARIHWTIAQERPYIYEILFQPGSITKTDDIAIRTKALMPLFVSVRALVGPGVALAAARTLSSYIHGFISLQMAGVFDQGAGLEGSFYFGLNAIIRGIVKGEED
jgi:AcrR family transcriptional regulator